MRYGSWLPWSFPILCMLLVGVSSAQESARAQVKRSGAEITLANQHLELVLSASGPSCRAVRLVNKLSGRTIPVRSDDFSIGLEGRTPLRLADFKLKEARDEATAAKQRLVLCMENAASGARLEIIYELGHADAFLRRRLDLTTKGPLALRQVDVWLVGVEDKCSHQGFGEPVLMDDTFWGVEFPASENHYADGLVKLSHFPGRTLQDRFTSKTAVLGVAQRGRAAQACQRYVETLSPPSSHAPLFVNYNTWWTLMPPTEANSLELIELFRKKLFEPHGQSIDTFTLDDGWDVDQSLWDINAKAFPNAFAPLVEALKAQKARLGIWLSPSSGYNHAPWLSQHGYQANSNPWYICSSEPKYRQDIVKRVTDLAAKYDVAFFKFDGFCASCDAPGHAHHLPGPYAKEANVEAFIELLTAVRRVQPGVYLDPTCGIWLSPWWLQYADSLWGEVSGDYPDIIVPAPIIRDSATTTRDAVFRQRCREHPGFPPAAIEHLGIIVITPEKWEDNAMIVVGRGARLLTLYVDPRHFTKGDRDWAFLGALLKWIRHNADVLRQSEPILGDPMKREPYGYAHFRGQRGIIALRNPFIEPRVVRVKLDESAGWERHDACPSMASSRYLARIVYPRHEVLAREPGFGDTLEVELQGYETLVVQIETVKPGLPALMGARYQETGREGSKVTYTVFGRPGQSTTLPFVRTRPPSKATLDGQAIAPAAIAQGVALPLAWPGPQRKCRVEGGQIVPQSSERGWTIAGQCVAHVPPATKAAIHLLYHPRGTAAGAVQCAASVNGKPVEVRAVRTPDKAQQAHGPHPWTWFEFPLPEGRSDVAVTLAPGAKPGPLRGELGWWLWAEHPLAKSTLIVEYAGPSPRAQPEPLPLAIHNDSERQIVTIQAPTLVRVGDRWPKEKPVVWLDEIEPDEVSQDYGKLETNRSVWQKPMIIAGQTCRRGLGSHANGRIEYDLTGGHFKTFRCQVGRDEHADDGRVVFEVWIDGKKVFDSGPMTKATPARPIEIGVSGAKTLELRALDGGDGISGDHANWADAQLLR